jgi:hypothetical protein
VREVREGSRLPSGKWGKGRHIYPRLLKRVMDEAALK